MKKKQLIIQLVFTALCFFILSRIISIDTFLNTAQKAAIGPLIIVLFAMLPAVFTRAWRWYFILSRKGVNVPLGVMYRVTFIGMALNLFLPAGTGDIVRSYYGWQSQGNKEAMLASAISDKVVALFTLSFIGVLCGLGIGEYRIVLVTAGLMIPLGFLLFIPWRLPWILASKLFGKITKKDLKIDELLRSFQMDLKTLSGSFIISLIGWGITNLMYYFSCLAFSSNTNILYIFSIAPLINIIRVIPITIAGLGSADALIVYFYDKMDVSKAEAMASSMVINLILIALPGLIGAVLLFFHKNKQISS